MKHYTYKERYELIRKALGAYMKNRSDKVVDNGYVRLGHGLPALKYAVAMSKDPRRRHLYLDVSAKAAPVGYGVDNIAKMGDPKTMPYIMQYALLQVENAVNHPLRDQEPSIKVDNAKKLVHFRYTLNPRKGL